MSLRKPLILATLMITGEAIFLLPFVVARIFRPTFLKVFEINNLQLGAAFSIYGVVAMISYFAGGPIADRFPPRKLLASSLIVTAVGGIFMAAIPSLTGLTLLYAFWGLSTILLFWAAFVKATRIIGGNKAQGTAFGMVDAGRGLVAALIASSSVFLFDAFLPNSEAMDQASLSSALGKIIFVFSGITLVSAALVWVVFPPDRSIEDTSSKMSLSGIQEALKRRSVWLQAIIVLCAYVGYKSTDDFSLYASVVFGYDDVEAAHVGTISFWARVVAALAAGLLGDRFKISNMVILCFVALTLGSLVISAGQLQPGFPVLFIALTIISTCTGIYGLRGLYYALFQESKVPLLYTGSAIGIISVIGYTPDIFMGPIMGFVLDDNPGLLGHQYLFGIVAFFGIIGLLASAGFKRLHS